MFRVLQQQFSRFWSQQSGTQRLILIILVILAVVLIPLFVVWATTPTYEVAFSGLSEADAGQIVEQLNSDNTPYKLRGSGTIMVPSNQVYEVRLKMARQGLPEGGTVGFEIFNGNTLGMTEFSQRVNYQQAIEGELERTIGSLSAVQAVRVHIVIPEKSILSSEQSPTTASVTIMEKPGMSIDGSQVRAITHLVASSVEGLKPENVVVVDVNGNMLASGEGSDQSNLTTQTDSRRTAELSAADQIKKKVQDILDKALGPNKSVVQADVSMDWTQRETSRQSYDPDQSVIRSAQDVKEVYTTTNGSLEGVPGATTNLPPAGTSTESGSNGLSYTRTESTINYEVTEVQTHEVQVPGDIQRISLSVLVDGITDTQQLETLQSVIAAAAGIDTNRGDNLAVQSLAFDRSYYQNQMTEVQKAEKQNMYFRYGEIGVAILVFALLFWYILRVLKNLRLTSMTAWTPIMRPVSEMALPMAGTQSKNSAGAGAPPANLLQNHAASVAPESQSLNQLTQAIENKKKIPKIELPTISPEFEQLQKTLDDVVDSDPTSIAEAIQLWLADDEKQHG